MRTFWRSILASSTNRRSIKSLGRAILMAGIVLMAGHADAQLPCSADCSVEVGKSFSVLFEASAAIPGVTLPADGYRIYLDNIRFGTDLPAAIGTITVPNVSVSAAGNHALRVAAFAGLVEATTADLKLIATAAPPPPDTTPPTAPQQLAAHPSDTSVILDWGQATDAVGVVGYRVSRNGTQVGTPMGVTFTDTGLLSNSSYVYAVTAVDAAGNVSVPATVTAQTLPGTPPPTCTANGKPYSITIAVQSYTKQLGPGARGQVLFTLANQFPITLLQVKLGTQVVGEIPATDLRDALGVGFSVPRTAGTYNLFVTAKDNAGCVTSTTVARPLVVQ